MSLDKKMVEDLLLMCDRIEENSTDFITISIEDTDQCPIFEGPVTFSTYQSKDDVNFIYNPDLVTKLAKVIKDHFEEQLFLDSVLESEGSDE